MPQGDRFAGELTARSMTGAAANAEHRRDTSLRAVRSAICPSRPLLGRWFLGRGTPKWLERRLRPHAVTMPPPPGGIVMPGENHLSPWKPSTCCFIRWACRCARACRADRSVFDVAAQLMPRLRWDTPGYERAQRSGFLLPSPCARSQDLGGLLIRLTARMGCCRRDRDQAAESHASRWCSACDYLE